LHDNDKSLSHYLGQLAGAEGLHQQLSQAQQQVHFLQERLARERFQAEAHRLLRATFERVRQAHVQRTVGPINDRVVAWAKRVGIDDYRALHFGDGVLPSGLLRHHAATDEAAVDWQTESYGRMELLCLLIRLAVGGLLARDEPAVAVLDDPLAHADNEKQRRFLEVLQAAAAGNPDVHPPAGPLQILVLTCHPERFDHLPAARHINLQQHLRRAPGPS
ncbi:MAG: hypothetical protein NZO58_13055, partial [Gemmataceae bacterium]|nr:hypothetical protein [Gemmataceae bacterium]